MAALDACDADTLSTKMNQKDLRRWKRAHPGHRSFTVVSHPLERAHHVFCHRILQTGPGSYLKIRETLRRHHELAVPDHGPDADYSLANHRAAFESFLSFVEKNLAAQTAVRVDASWASQSVILSSFGDLALPDYVLRQDELVDLLPDLARRVGHAAPQSYEPQMAQSPYPLAEIYDDAIEEKISRLYQRDYMTFGFRAWNSE